LSGFFCLKQLSIRILRFFDKLNYQQVVLFFLRIFYPNLAKIILMEWISEIRFALVV
jgi:hypothetical protein